jgi:hypothetical protein
MGNKDDETDADWTPSAEKCADNPTITDVWQMKQSDIITWLYALENNILHPHQASPCSHLSLSHQ